MRATRSRAAWPARFHDEAAVEHARHLRQAPTGCSVPRALSHVDYCESHVDEAIAIEPRRAAHLARMGQRFRGAGFVYYSTDYVFDGVDGPYAEGDPPRPLNVYGRSKLEAERAMLDAIARALVVRTSVVYGPERQEKNFVYQLIRACRERQGLPPRGGSAREPHLQSGLAAATVELLRAGARRHLSRGRRGHAGSLGLRPADLARLRPGRLGTSDAGKTAELKQQAARPLNGGLRVEKAQAAVRTRLRGAAEGLRRDGFPLPSGEREG